MQIKNLKTSIKNNKKTLLLLERNKPKDLIEIKRTKLRLQFHTKLLRKLE